MHPVLQAAIDNPRMPRPYGSDPGDIGYNNHLSGNMAVDTYMAKMLAQTDRRRRPGSSGDHQYH